MLEDKSALVTGAGSGIGAAIARALAGAGAHVTVADVDPESAASVADEVSGRAWVIDLSDTAALAELRLEHDILGEQRGHPVRRADRELPAGEVSADPRPDA